MIQISIIEFQPGFPRSARKIFPPVRPKNCDDVRIVDTFLHTGCITKRSINRYCWLLYLLGYFNLLSHVGRDRVQTMSFLAIFLDFSHEFILNGCASLKCASYTCVFTFERRQTFLLVFMPFVIGNRKRPDFVIGETTINRNT